MATERVFKIVVSENVKNGGEGFFHYVIGGARHLGDGGTHVVTAFRALDRHATAAMEARAVAARPLQRLFHGLKGAAVDQRPDQGIAVQRVADAHSVISVFQAGDQTIVNRAMNENAPGRGAALAAGADRAKQNRPARHFQVGGWRHDDGVVAAQFQDAAAEARRDARTDDVAHGGAAGGRDHRHARIVNQRRADLAAADNEAGQTLRRIAETRQGALQQMMGGQRRDRRLFRRLPNERIAAHQRQGGVPRPHRHWKIKGADDAHRPDGMPGFHHAMAGAFRRDGQAVKLARQADRKVADVDHLLHFAQAFLQNLAAFQGNERA